ncbi:MAG: DUF3854 domain-containing protein, partial [Dehalococcoidales bacterium]
MNIRPLGSSEMAATSIASSRVPEGYVIPYFDFYGEVAPYYRIKILDPHSPMKYLAIKDMPNHIYFPPGLAPMLKQGHHKVIIVTEGEKKAAAAVKCGFPAVALSGVDNWRTRNILLPAKTEFTPMKNGNVIKAKIPRGDSNALVMQDSGTVAVGFHDFIDHMVAEEMTAIIIFDSDTPDGVKNQVQRAAAQLGYELRYRGLPIANIRQLVLPTGKVGKMGLDDYLVARGTKHFAGLVRACRRKRIAFPRHPNPKTFVASRLQKSRLSRKETQDVSLAILMELECRGKRLRNKSTQDMYYFNEQSHTLMSVHLGDPRVPLHDTPFGAHLYREYNLAAIDQKVVAWLAAQFHGEPGIEEALMHRVFAKPEDMPDCLAYQLSDSHFVIITPNPAKPYIICENGTHGVLFEQGHVSSINHVRMEIALEDMLENDTVWWQKVMQGFEFIPNVGSEQVDQVELVMQGQMLATLLYYIS